MSVYIFNILIIILCSCICFADFKIGNRYTLEGKTIYAAIVFFSFTFIMAMRAVSVGVDTAPYSRIFAYIGHFDTLQKAFLSSSNMTPCYTLFCWLLYQITEDPQILICVSSLFISIGLFSFIKKTSDNYIISYSTWVGLTMFYASMNGHRQFMALVLTLNALYYLLENLLNKKGWLLMLIAMGFHATSFFVFIAILGILLAECVKNNKITYLVSVLFSIVIAILFNRIIPLSAAFLPRYEMYITGSATYNILIGSGSGRIVILYLLLFSITLLWLLKNYDKAIEEDNFNSKLLPAVIFGSIFGIFNAKNELLNRLLWYYISLFISFIPATVKNYDKVLKPVIMYGIVIALYIYSFISLIENQNGVMPYVFFWNAV